MDEVIRLIRASATPAEARDGLMKRFSLTQIQAQAILDMRLGRLTSRLQIIELRAEYEEVIKLITELRGILEDPKSFLRSSGASFLKSRRNTPCREGPPWSTAIRKSPWTKAS